MAHLIYPSNIFPSTLTVPSMTPPAPDRLPYLPASQSSNISAASFHQHSSSSSPAADPSFPDPHATTASSQSSSPQEQLPDADDVFRKLLSMRISASSADRFASSACTAVSTPAAASLPSAPSPPPNHYAMMSTAPAPIPSNGLPSASATSSSPLPSQSPLAASPSTVLPPTPVSELVFDNLVPPHTLSLLRASDPAAVARFTPHLHSGLFTLHDIDSTLSPRDPRLCLSSTSALSARPSVLRQTSPIQAQSPLAPLGIIPSVHNPRLASPLDNIVNDSTTISNVNALSATPRIKNDLYKTEICRSYAENGGYCKYGSKCQFAHGDAELRPVRRHPRYKTKLCRNFLATGSCPYDARCRFIHAPADFMNGSLDVASPRAMAKNNPTACPSPLSHQYAQSVPVGVPAMPVHPAVSNMSPTSLSSGPLSATALPTTAFSNMSTSAVAASRVASGSPAVVFSPDTSGIGLMSNGELLFANAAYDPENSSENIVHAVNGAYCNNQDASSMLAHIGNCNDGFDDGCGISLMGFTQGDMSDGNGIPHSHDMIGDGDNGESMGLYTMKELVGQDIVSGSVANANSDDSVMGSQSLPHDTDVNGVVRGNSSGAAASGTASRSRLPVFRNMAEADEE